MSQRNHFYAPPLNFPPSPFQYGVSHITGKPKKKTNWTFFN
jgi:hypothetical protein